MKTTIIYTGDPSKFRETWENHKHFFKKCGVTTISHIVPDNISQEDLDFINSIDFEGGTILTKVPRNEDIINHTVHLLEDRIVKLSVANKFKRPQFYYMRDLYILKKMWDENYHYLKNRTDLVLFLKYDVLYEKFLLKENMSSISTQLCPTAFNYKSTFDLAWCHVGAFENLLNAPYVINTLLGINELHTRLETDYPKDIALFESFDLDHIIKLVYGPGYYTLDIAGENMVINRLDENVDYSTMSFITNLAARHYNKLFYKDDRFFYDMEDGHWVDLELSKDEIKKCKDLFDQDNEYKYIVYEDYIDKPYFWARTGKKYSYIIEYHPDSIEEMYPETFSNEKV